ncbi:MAG: hypothetical protein LBT56_04355 [Prevotellaceae bacterium]|jgi:hypothetical protein|nr:hypothetical protein [Prevotellaceae bacterium]
MTNATANNMTAKAYKAHENVLQHYCKYHLPFGIACSNIANTTEASPTLSEHSESYTKPLPTVSEHSESYTKALLTVSEHSESYTKPLLTVSEHSESYTKPRPNEKRYYKLIKI